MKVKSKERKWKRKVKRLSCFSFVLVKGSWHREPLGLSLAVDTVANSFTPVRWAWSIFDVDTSPTVFLGPGVGGISPFSVVGDLWRRNLNAVKTTPIPFWRLPAEMSHMVALTTPKVSDIVIGSSTDFHTMPLLAMGISLEATSSLVSVVSGVVVHSSVVMGIVRSYLHLSCGTMCTHALAMHIEVDGVRVVVVHHKFFCFGLIN